MSDSALGTTEQQPQLLDHLLAIGQAIQRDITQNPKRVYQLIIETICRQSGADCAVLYPYHPSFGEFYDLENVATFGLCHELEVMERIDKIKGLTARVHLESEVICEDIEREDLQILQTDPFISREGIKAFMGLSLKLGGDIVGLLYVDYRKPHYFSEEERRIIRLLGQQASLAVSNSWTYRLAGIRAEAVVKLKAIGQALTAIKAPSEKLESILVKIANSAQEVLGADIVDLYQYNQAKGEFLMPATSAGKKRYPHISKAKIFNDDVAKKAAMKREPQYFQKSQETPWLIQTYGGPPEDISRQRFVIREGIVSSAAIPLITRGETVGVMFVNYRLAQLFGPEQKNVIETFATQAAIAIYDARYYHLIPEEPSSETVPEVVQVLKPEEVINSVLDQLSNIIDYDSASIQLIQGDTRIQVGGRGFAEQEFHPEHLPNISRDPLVKSIVASAHPMPMVISDVNQHSLWKRTPQTYHVNSWMGVPLIVKDQVVGLLTLDHRRVGYYTSKSGQVVANFAKKVAATIYNSHLFNIFDRRVEAFTALNTVGQALTSDLRLQEDEILGLICKQTGKLVDAQEMYIALYDEITKIVRFGVVMKGGQRADIINEEDFQPRRINPTELGKTEAVILKQKPILHKTRAEEKAWYSQPGRRAYPGQVAASHLAVPMMIGQRILGVIAVYNWERERAYDELDREVLFSMASQAAIALENARLYQGLEHQVEALSALNEVGKKLTSVRLKEDEILSLIYQQVGNLAHTQNVNIALYDEKTNTLTFKLVMERGRRVDIEQEKRFAPRQIDKAKVGKTEEIILTRQPILHKTREETVGWYKKRGHRDYNAAGEISASHLAVPMILGQKAIGVIAIYDWDQEYAYDEQDKQVLSVIAGQAAIALENAYLFYEVNQKLERQVKALTALNEVGQTLTCGLRLQQDDILELIYEQARKLTGTRDMYIALYDETTQMIQFKLAMEKGQRVEYESRQVDMRQRGKTEEIIFTQQPILHQTQKEAENWYRVPGRQEYIGKVSLSYLGVPMMLGKKVLGVIAAWDWEREYAYDELDQQVLSSMANQAAIALENAYLFYEVNQKLERQVKALTALNEVGQTLTSGLRLKEDEILELIYEQARRLTDTQEMYIALYDEITQMINFGMAIQQGKQVAIESRRANMERQGKTEEVILTKQPLLHKTREESEGWYKLPGHQEFLRPVQSTFLGVPMKVGERVLGMIAVYDWEQEYAYDELDLQVLSSMASQAAIALDNARFAAERQRRLDLLQKISAKMAAAGREPDEVLTLVAQATNDVSHSDLTGIYLYDQGTARFTRGVWALREGETESVEVRQLPKPADFAGQIAKSQDVVFVDDTENFPNISVFAERHHMRAFAALPLVVAGVGGVPATVGVLFVNFKTPHIFSEDEQEILGHLANQAAVAVAFAFAQASAHAAEQLAALGTAAGTLQHRLGNTLNVILPAVMRLRHRTGDDPTSKDILDTIERNALFAGDVIRRMQTPLRQEPFILTNFNALLRDAIDRCIQDKDRFPNIPIIVTPFHRSSRHPTPVTSSQPQIIITPNLDEQLPQTYASVGQLTEVFRVLVENAIKAIYPQAGWVKVTSKLERSDLGQFVEITISDTGRGIDEITQARLFKQPVPRKEFGQGAGLGLWLSGIIVRSHQGFIRLQATELNKGSTFGVRLPILAQPPLSSMAQKGEEE